MFNYLIKTTDGLIGFDKTERRSGAEGLGEVGGVANKGRGGPQSGGNILQGGNTGGTPIWPEYLVTVGGNGEDGVWDSHWVSETNHGEAGTAEVIWYVGYSQGGNSAGSGGNPVGNDLHWNNTGGSGTVGGAAAGF